MSPFNRIYREVDAGASAGDHAEGPARRALLSGVLLSACLLLLGLLLALLRHEPRPDEPPGIRLLLRHQAPLNGVALIYLGLLALTFTPVLRVASMATIYLRRREWFMLVVTLIVLGLLTLSLVLGTG